MFFFNVVESLQIMVNGLIQSTFAGNIALLAIAMGLHIHAYSTGRQSGAVWSMTAAANRMCPGVPLFYYVLFPWKKWCWCFILWWSLWGGDGGDGEVY